jgi:phosphate-selective porin
MTNLAGIVPDSESGEVMRKFESWNSYDGKWMSAQLGWIVIGDAAAASQNQASKSQVGNIGDDAEFRAFRLYTRGQIKFANPWTYFIAGEYKGFAQDPGAPNWQLTDVALTIPLNDTFGKLTVGKTKETMGMEVLMAGTATPMMERAAVLSAFVPTRDVGIKLANSFLDQRATWSVGVFNNWFATDNSFNANGSTISARLSGLPLYNDNGRELIHLGASFRYVQAENDSVRYRSRPEVNTAPYFVDTGSFVSDHSDILGLEAGWVEGPFTLYGEYLFNWVDSSSTGNPFFSGYYVTASYLLTGEVRPYNRSSGLFGKVVPLHPFNFHGEWGAWEIAARFSEVDLNDAEVQGGQFERTSLGVNWHLTEQWRWSFNYGYTDFNRNGTTGHAQFFQTRVQWEF